MKAPYEAGQPLSARLLTWWRNVPEPTYDSSVRAPQDHSPTIIVAAIAIAMGAVVLSEILQRAGLLP